MSDNINESDVQKVFEEVNQLLAGRQTEVVIAALQDLLVASLCYTSPTKQVAKAFCSAIHEDLQKTIDKNFDHYHSRKNASNAAKRLSH